MPALERGHRAKIDLGLRQARAAVAQDAIEGGDAVGKAFDDRYLAHVGAGLARSVGDRGRPAIIDAAERGIALALEPEHARLDRRIVLHRAVPVEMIRRQVGEDADFRLKAGHQVDLERRQLQNIDAAFDRLAQQENRRADIAADIDIEPASLSTWPVSAVVVDCHWCR